MTVAPSAKEPHGLVVIDKPSGPTSHDVVSRVRRTLRTKRVGHAGTLDPMASGVLVVLVGEATKLAAYVTAQRKRYEARVVLGCATTTLDALGEPTGSRAPSTAALDGLRRAERGDHDFVKPLLEAERARKTQVPPAYSAIHVGGRRSYERARAGEDVVLPPREVEIEALELLGIGNLDGPQPFLDVELTVSKGYYVRSLARDLGEALGCDAHLGALRRTASGPFEVGDAVPLGADETAFRAALKSLEEAARAAMCVATLTEDGHRRVRFGQHPGPRDFLSLPPPGVSAWLSPEHQLVAVGSVEGAKIEILRGFSAS